MKDVTLTVTGMSCGHCVNSIESALKEIGAAAKVNLENKTVKAEFDESAVSLDKIKETIEDQGYNVQ